MTQSNNDTSIYFLQNVYFDTKRSLPSLERKPAVFHVTSPHGSSEWQNCGRGREGRSHDERALVPGGIYTAAPGCAAGRTTDTTSRTT